MNKRLGIWQYVKSYKFNSIFVRNFLLIILLIVLPLLGISISIYSYYNNIASEEISKSNMNEIYKIRDIVDMVSLEVDRLSLRITADPDIESFLQYEKPSIMNSATIDLVQKIQKILTVLNIIPNYIDSILVYSEKNGYVITSAKEVNTEWRGLDQSWKESYTKNGGNQDSWYAGITMQKDSMPQRYLSNFRKGPLYKQNKSGVVIINIDVNKLNDLLKSKNADRRMFVVGSNDEILYSSNEAEDIARQDINALKDKLQQNQEYTFINAQKGEKEVISMVRSKYNGWIFVSIMPMEQYEERIVHLKKYMTFSVILNIFIAVFVSFFITVKVFNPIKKIMEVVSDPQDLALNNVNAGNNNVSNEFKYIVTNISSSYMENTQMKEELIRRQELLRKAQSIALQSQINPHFLYNTLENINWKVMGLTGGQNEGSEMISLLSHLLRLSLQTESYLIPITEEMEHARLYIEIQKKRYDDKFDVEWNVQDEVLHYMIIKISIQPIVENAIYHGIKQLEGKGLIRIDAWLEEENIIIQVSDNGIGLTEEQVCSINDDLQNAYIKENEHIGIRNVNQRIRLNFGDQYGLTLSRNGDCGTRVTMRLPKISEHDSTQGEG